MENILEFFYNLVSPFPIWLQFLVYYILFYIFSFLLLSALRAVEIYVVYKSKYDYFNGGMNDQLTMRKVILRSLFMALDLTVIVIIGYIRNYLK